MEAESDVFRLDRNLCSRGVCPHNIQPGFLDLPMDIHNDMDC